MDSRRDWVRSRVEEICATLDYEQVPPIEFVEDPPRMLVHTWQRSASSAPGDRELRIAPSALETMSDRELLFRMTVVLVMSSPQEVKRVRNALKQVVGAIGACLAVAMLLAPISWEVALLCVTGAVLLHVNLLKLPQAAARKRNFIRALEMTGDKDSALRLLAPRKRPTGLADSVRWLWTTSVNQMTIDAIDRSSAKRVWKARTRT